MAIKKNISLDTENKISLNTAQMSDFQRWKKVNGDNFSLLDYLAGVANVEVALAFTKLFLPDFIEHDGGIFLAEAFNQEIYEQWKAQLGNDIAAIERVMNHQHIDDWLPGADRVGTDNLLYLGQAIKQMWESRLKSVYPQRNFLVSCTRDDYTVVVTFSGFGSVLTTKKKENPGDMNIRIKEDPDLTIIPQPSKRRVSHKSRG